MGHLDRAPTVKSGATAIMTNWVLFEVRTRRRYSPKVEPPGVVHVQHFEADRPDHRASRNVARRQRGRGVDRYSWLNKFNIKFHTLFRPSGALGRRAGRSATCHPRSLGETKRMFTLVKTPIRLDLWFWHWRIAVRVTRTRRLSEM
jgi:hypothetical protein